MQDKYLDKCLHVQQQLSTVLPQNICNLLFVFLKATISMLIL